MESNLSICFVFTKRLVVAFDSKWLWNGCGAAAAGAQMRGRGETQTQTQTQTRNPNPNPKPKPPPEKPHPNPNLGYQTPLTLGRTQAPLTPLDQLGCLRTCACGFDFDGADTATLTAKLTERGLSTEGASRTLLTRLRDASTENARAPRASRRECVQQLVHGCEGKGDA